MLVTTAVMVVMLAAGAVIAGDDEKLFKKFGMVKIFESCFGPELNKAYMKKTYEAAARCKAMPVRAPAVVPPSRLASFSPLQGTAFGGSAGSLQTPPSNSFINSQRKVVNSPMTLQGFDWSSFFAKAAQQTAGNTQFIPIPVYVSDPAYRTKRGAGSFKYFTEDRVRAITQKMQAKVSNLTCIMREMGYMDSSDEVLYNAMVTEIRSLRLEPELELDLVEAVEDCKQMAMCVPTKDSQVPMTPALMRFKVFHKCNMHMKFMACMKKDLRGKRDEFDLSGLGDSLDGADDDEKMLAIIWGKTVVGGDGFSF